MAIFRGVRFLVRRLGAFAADCGLLFLVLAPLGLAIQFALGVRPEAPREIYLALLLNFSLPVWTYFAWSDARSGATIGKRWTGLRVSAAGGRRLGPGRALARTAGKLLPWELTHAAMFAVPASMDTLGVVSWIGLGVAYSLALAWIGVAWRSGGRRSVHDLVTGTRVERAS